MYSAPVQNVNIPNVQYDQEVPYYRPIERGFLPPKIIRIVAIPKANAHSFTVNFKNGGDIAFHFNARFNERAVVRNNMKYGGWQNEERRGHFPFHPGKPFTLEFEAEFNLVNVKVNGEEHSQFHHRDNFREVDQLEINGDIETLHCVSLGDK